MTIRSQTFQVEFRSVLPATLYLKMIQVKVGLYCIVFIDLVLYLFPLFVLELFYWSVK